MKLQQITDHIYTTPPIEATDRPLLGAVIGEKFTLMVDAGNSPDHANQFLKLLKQYGLKAPDYLVLTHWHWDHVFGVHTINATLIAQDETTRKLQEMSRLSWKDKALDQRVEEGAEIEFCSDHMKIELSDRQRAQIKIKIPEVSFEKHLTLDLGNLTAQIIHVGGDHSADSSVVFIPEEKVVFMGDCMYDTIYETPRRYTPRKIFPLLEKLLSLNAAFYFDGHSVQPMSFSELETFTNYLRTISRLVSENAEDLASLQTKLSKALARELNEEDQEYIENFLNGR